MSDDVELLARLNAGPSFLLLGQGLTRGRLTDHAKPWLFPEELSRIASTGFDGGTALAFKQYEELAQTFERPPSVDQIGAVRWNAVLTTRIDSNLAQWLEADWRRIVPTASSETRTSRSTTELQVRHLFGGLGLPSDEQPPTDHIAWIESHARANDTLTSFASNVITPKGIVLVEDWTPQDWLSAQDLYLFANRLGPGRVHLFSVTTEIAADSLIAEAINKGVITAHKEALAKFLEAASESGALHYSTTSGANSRFIPAGTRFAPMDVEMWNRIVGSARPVDIELLEPFGHASDPQTYQRFRTFLGSSEGAPPWRAVASGMKLPRTYETQLLNDVEAALAEADEVAPVILMGQTATGKSLALVWLAQQLAKSGKAAVLHQSRRRERPVAADVEAYSIWAEAEAGLKTVLIWDGMLDTDEYFALHRQLRARGQRVLIVGSTYLNAVADRMITAPIHLDKAEAADYEPWLRSFGINLPPAGVKSDTSVLAMLYRAIPETESSLRRGLALEMRAAESGIESLARERSKQEPESRMTAVAKALLEAGLRVDILTPSDHPDEDLKGIAFGERSTTEQLSAMLLTAGRRGLSVPLELALRTVGRQGSTAITEFISQFDIFRWTEDANGNQFLGVRTRLEAELLALDALSERTEIEVLASFIEFLRPQHSAKTGGDEVQFIVDFLDQVGPQSTETGRFGAWYGDLAEAFASQRQQGGPGHPRLVLLEVNLVREFVKRAQRNNELTRAERIARLRDSEDLLRRTLEDSEIASARARLNLYVELAACIGSQAYEVVADESTSSTQAVTPILERLLDAVMHARAADPENIYPVDVLAWATKDAVTSGGMTPEARVSLLADAKASLDSIDPDDLAPGQRAKYTQRQADIAALLGDKDLETSFLSELMAMDDPAAYYILATRALASRSPDSVNTALQVLLGAPASIRDDWKCARLLLDLYWQDRTGARFLRGARNTVAFTRTDWLDCLELLDTLHGAAEFDQYRISFLRGLAQFHIGSVASSQSEFQALGSRVIDVNRRVYLAYLASDDSGQPRTFTGRVALASPDGRKGKVWVDQLKANVDFVPLRFSTDGLRTKGEVVPRFHIGFNYLGPIADPIRPKPRGNGGRAA